MSLEDLRKKIDTLDSRIVALLNERSEVSSAIGKEKLKNKKEVYAPEREKEVLRRVQSLNEGKIPPAALQAIYREIMSASLAVEKPFSIAALGQQGAFTNMAARKIFGSQMQYISCSLISEVFQSVERGECDYGVVPVENSTEGAVTPTFDLLVDTELKICRQGLLEIRHNLLSHSPLNKIKTIYSNPQVFDQCRNWLIANFPKIGRIFVASTTEAAAICARKKDCAAIASSEASEVYDLPIVKADIQDIAHNMTRFLVLGNKDAAATGCDRTSILFSIKDKVGALYSMLKPFYTNKINLTKIESRPSKKKVWDYYFFVDFEGHRLDPNVKKALSELEDMCKYLKILGSYPSLE